MNQCPRPAPLQLVGALALAGGLLFASGFVLEHLFAIKPCPMCWWQRYAHLAILTFALLGIVAGKPRPAAWLVMGAAATGLAIALWQVAGQQGWLPFPPSCTSTELLPLTAGADLLGAMQGPSVVPCDVETFTLFGLSLAAWNIPAMLLCLGLAAWAVAPCAQGKPTP